MYIHINIEIYYMMMYAYENRRIDGNEFYQFIHI
jgi:hypothetical protein